MLLTALTRLCCRVAEVPSHQASQNAEGGRGELFLERRVQHFSEPGRPRLGLKDDWEFSGP